jgi:cytochrome b561
MTADMARVGSQSGQAAERYNRVAMLLHWVIAAAILCNLAGG